MKLNISFQPTPIMGYTNHAILAKNGFALSDIDDGELEEILATNVIEYVFRPIFDSVLQEMVKKLAHKGRLILDFVDLYTVCRLYFMQTIDMSTVNNLLHGPQTTDWDTKRLNLTIPEMCKTLESLGLKVLSKNLDGVYATIIAERP